MLFNYAPGLNKDFTEAKQMINFEMIKSEVNRCIRDIKYFRENI